MTEQTTTIGNETEILNKKIYTLNQELQRRSMERMAIKTLSSELKSTLDLGEAIDVVNRYLWELLDFSTSMYIIYNFTDTLFETRAYLKESVNTQYLDISHKQLEKYVLDNADDAVVGAASSVVKKIDPLLFGLEKNDSVESEIKSNFVTPLKIGGKIVGALNITSTKTENFTPKEVELVEMLVEVASVSIARIQTLLRSMNSSTEALVQSISNGVVMFDKDFEVTLANEVAMRYTGLPKEGYNLKEMTTLFTEIDLMDLVYKSLTGSEVLQVPRTKVSRFWYELSVLPVKNYQNEVMGGAIVMHDITHIVEVDKAKTEFVSLASHQLRTPLSAIRWYSEMLLTQDVGELNKEQRELLEVVDKSNKRMIELVNSLLNVSRIELGTFAVDPEDVDLVELIKSVISEQEHRIKEKNQTVTQHLAENIGMYKADPALTRMIVQNLVSNAIKYSPEDTEIGVGLEKQEDGILFIVADHGFGIPKAQQGQIFEKLFRADNAKSQEVDGNGLGLYIIRAIVEEVNGRIWFESEENKGTTFYVKLPLEGMKQKTGAKALEQTK